MRQQASPPTVSAPVPADGLLVGRPAAGACLVRIRPAEPADVEALARMFGRCTTATRHRRFHAPVKAIPARYLAEALSGSPLHLALVACPEPDSAPEPGLAPVPEPAAAGTPPGDIVALASSRLVDEGAAELGLLIEDAWQRRGLGTRLLRDLVTHASRAGLRLLEAQILAEQAWIAGMLKPYGECRLGSAWDGVLNLTLRLDM